MKKYFILTVLCIASLMSSCSKEDEGETLMVNNINIAGTWAQIGSVWDDGGDTDITKEWQDGGKIMDIMIVKANGIIHYYAPTESWYNKWNEDWTQDKGFTFIDGYIQGCDMSDFEEYAASQFSIEDGRLYVLGYWFDLRLEKKDIVTWYEGGLPYMRYKRVYGFN